MLLGVEMRFHYVSGLREEDVCEICVNDLLEFALKISQKMINKKKLEILKIISSQEEPKTITSIVDLISKNLGYPKSTVWVNVSCLKDFGLIQNGRSQPVKVTKLGELILKNLLKEVEKNGNE